MRYRVSFLQSCKLFLFLFSIVIVTASLKLKDDLMKPVPSIQKDDIKLRKNGCIVSLAMGWEDVLMYNKSLLIRNTAIRRHLYTLESCTTGNCKAVADVIIFHEGNIIKSHQDYIQSATPDMPIKFVNVSDVFQHFHPVYNPICPPSYLSSAGYHSMCYFWFLKFQDYVSQYDWMLRIDSNCILKSDSRAVINHMNESTHFSTTRWINMDRMKHDTISETQEGVVVRGMRNLTQNFAIEHGIYKHITTWKGPYTNVMYINLNWLRGNVIIKKYMKAVEDSECIYGNRWGDLPLWGAAIHIAKEPTLKLPLRYYHGSHDTLVG